MRERQENSSSEYQIKAIKGSVSVISFGEGSEVNLLPEPVVCQSGIQNSDFEVDVANLGLDFGTSSLKAIVGFRSNYYPVPFLDDSGINRFLLPTRVWEEEGIFNLDGRGTLHGDIKLKLLQPPVNEKNIENAVGFLALALRRLKNNVLLEYPDDFKNLQLMWSVQMGVPSESVTDEKLDLWEKILCTGWALSVADVPISRLYAQFFLQYYECLKETTDLLPEGRGVFPELSAELFSLVDSRAEHEEKTSYVLVDIGSGTTDVAAVNFTKGYKDYRYETLVFSRSVKNFGTSICHSERITNWLEAIKVWNERRVPRIGKEVQDSLISIKDLPATAKLPNRAEDYLLGIEVSCSGWDAWVKGGVGTQISDAFAALREYRAEGVHERIVMVAAGGGSLSSVYQEPLSLRDRKAAAYFNSQVSLKNIKTSEEVFLSDTSIWQRLAVAYGLAKGTFGRTKFSTKSSATTYSYIEKELKKGKVYDVYKAYQARFISKDDV